jgi:peptide/nickel transport system substrate-binding protein
MTALAVTTPVEAEDKALVVAVTKLTITLDPMGSNSNVNERVSNNLIETLIAMNFKTGALEPGLAESWKFVNDKLLELKIRKGVKCHNGEDFNAEDVEYMFGPARYNADDAPGNKIAKQFLGTIESVKAVDSHTVHVTTSVLDPLLELRLANWMSQCPCADAYKAAESWEKWGQSVIGTGPYKLVKFQPGDYQQFERFDDYWGPKPPVKGFTLKVIPETSARIAGLITGEYDIITEIVPDQFKTIEKNPNAEIVGGPVNNIRVIIYDTRHPALKDARVRRAMNLAIDRDVIVKSYFGGRTTVPNGLQMEEFGDMYVADHEGATYNPEAAKKLLKEAGYKGTPISYRYLQDYYTGEVATAQILTSMWKQVGLDIKLELKENWAQVEEPISDKGRGVINWSNGAYYPDPLGQLYRLYGPAGFFQRNNYWTNAEFNEQAKSLFMKDLEKRKAAAARMLEIYESDPPGTYLHVLPMFYGKQKTLNWQPMKTAFMDFRAQGLGSK